MMGIRRFIKFLACGKRQKAAIAVLLLPVIAVLFVSRSGAASSAGSVSGIVKDHNGPLQGVSVRVQGASATATTDESGRFALSGLAPGKRISLSAWKEGYYNSLVRNVVPPATGLQLNLLRYQHNDNFRYEWLSPVGKGSCRECHPAVTEMSLNDAHLKSARNPRFLTMYEGTDMKGRRSPPTLYSSGGSFWNNTMLPQKPDLSKPYYGPGYLLDFPGTTGNCASCHVPGMAVTRDADPRKAKGAHRHGVHCDFCHKVADVHLNPVTKMPHDGVPGVRSMEIRRPFKNDSGCDQLFFGTIEDVNAPANDAYLPLLRESRFCASCHFGVFWSTVIYNSYGEWLHSPYADPKSGKAKTCQECHMPSPTIYKGRKLTNIAAGKGGIERDPSTIHNHNMTVDAKLLRNSLNMDASAKVNGEKLIVDVILTNDKTGHHIPTDSPLRHLILLVDARDARGKPLKHVSGPSLPKWCGSGKKIKGHYAGQPGKTYAKLLKEKWTEVFPTGAYWNHTELVSDNRLAAFASDKSSFAFARPQGGKALITVKLLYRRAFITLMEQKKWNVPDIVMAEKQFMLAGEGEK